jgi:two-component system sensor histidine kinase RegB
MRLLGEQAHRCRDILAKLTELSTSAGPFDRMKLSGLIEEVVAPHRNFGVAIEVKLPPDRAAEPVGARNPAVLYGLGNLVENAVDFARLRVELLAEWSEEEVTVTVADDGPGFAPEVLGRLGEPYVTSRGSGRPAGEPESGGLGLGFFIAKTLIERSGGSLSCANRSPPQSGAVVKVRWARADFAKQLEISEVSSPVRP